VEEDAEPVNDAPLRGREPCEFLRRCISRIAFRRFGRRELVGEAELPEDQHVRPEKPHAVGIGHDDVRGCQGEIEEADVQGGLERLADPRRQLECPRGCERGRLPEEIRQRRALDDLGDQEELARVGEVALVYRGERAGQPRSWRAVRGGAAKVLDPSSVVPSKLVEDLNRHRSASVGLLSPVEGRNAPDLERAGQAVPISQHRARRPGRREAESERSLERATDALDTVARPRGRTAHVAHGSPPSGAGRPSCPAPP
jgi:hypothetical protein